MTQLRDLLAKATKGEWRSVTRDDGDEWTVESSEWQVAAIGATGPQGNANAALIVAAINSLPELLDVADAAQALLDDTEREWCLVCQANDAEQGIGHNPDCSWEALRNALAALKGEK